jgi:glycosyltransferase involved in cell wall biosynthesis
MNISVITVCLNPGRDIDRTIQSIVTQSHLALQWIVIDGGSTDGTVELLKSLSRPPDRLTSERDNGIAEAMNKGIAQACGDAVVFMNAGDAFAEPSSLARLVSGWDATSHPWAFGDAWVHAQDGQELYARTASDTSFRALLSRHCGIQHASAIVLRRLFEEIGLFSGDYRLAFDYEFWVRCFAQGKIPQHVPGAVSRFYLGGVSGNIAKRDKEWQLARARHGLSNSWPLETWLTTVSRAKHITAPLLRRCRWAYRVKEALGW